MGADEYTDYGSLLGVSESVNPYIATNSKKMSHHILLINYITLISIDICTDSAHKLSKQVFCPHRYGTYMHTLGTPTTYKCVCDYVETHINAVRYSAMEII